MKKYPRPATRAQQAHQMWPILTSWVMHGVVGRIEDQRLITYGELATLMGYTAQAGRTLGSALGLVSGYCDMNRVPHLNSIVVDFETEQPGAGVPLPPGASLAKMQERTLEFDWFAYRAPTLRNFRDLQGRYPTASI